MTVQKVKVQRSFARRSSRTSARSFRSSADSSLVTPGRAPASVSDRRTLPQRLATADSQLLRYRANRGPLRRVIRPDLGDHLDRTLPQLRGVIR